MIQAMHERQLGSSRVRLSDSGSEKEMSRWVEVTVMEAYSLINPAYGSGYFHLRRTPVTEYFAYHGSSGAARDHRAAPQNTLPTTDPAELREIIVRQGAVIRSYQDQVEELQGKLRSASTAAPRDPPAARGESPQLTMPEKFDGSADRCRGFLRQCEVFLSHQVGIYGEEGTRCAFLLSLLTSRALEWASALWDADPQIRSSFSYFAGMIREVFEYPTGGKDISIQLMELHLSPRCPEKSSSAQVGGSSLFFSLTVPVSLCFSDRCVPVPALIDSGAALVEELGIPTFPCVPSLKLTAIDSQPIGEGYLKRQTQLLEFQVGLFHHEQLEFYVTSSPANPVILGFPWLWHHDPQISWRSRELVCWSPTCLKECLRESVSQPCRTSCMKEAIPAAHRHIPQAYADFQEVFSEERAARLLAHQAWDCAIDLLPNASPLGGESTPCRYQRPRLWRIT
ncbi:hypothetical protein QTP70_005337 [Hemibagrus guttatus]|uniref:DUF4939 domain-containing protein n=1 Tax=Hemibagrus guttatus TaxID=175788 RepID=A0AAE0QKC0_9TELE|nr:hypothetical protein QTP70_005337 [Hemibagrus guttatus]KAK3554993.1 hypothetical protein QTP86_005406 [Hemibagrus guttatus]